MCLFFDVFFSQDPDRSTSEKLADHYPASLHWEKNRVSDVSPGPILDSEYIGRQIHAPIHICDDGMLTPAAFSDTFNKGLSVNRFRIESLSSLHKAGEAKAARDRDRDSTRKYCGIVVAAVSDVRNIVDSSDGERTFGVYDTALDHSISHGDVCLVRPESINGLPKKALKLERRDRLRSAFGALQPPNFAVDGC